jgi:hypothetical protein
MPSGLNASTGDARLAKWVFLAAGLFGVLMLTPQYFLEARYSHDHPPAITHPEFYYGFAGVALTCQVLFILISTDPIRYRPVMLIGVMEKASFAIATPILYFAHRAPGFMAAMAIVDALWAVVFVAAYLKTPRHV